MKIQPGPDIIDTWRVPDSKSKIKKASKKSVGKQPEVYFMFNSFAIIIVFKNSIGCSEIQSFKKVHEKDEMIPYSGTLLDELHVQQSYCRDIIWMYRVE